MHDFSCVDPDDMYSQELAERTRFFKNSEEGRRIMSSVWKEAQEEAERRANEATAIRMLKAGKLAIEEIANYSALSLTAVKNLAQAVSLDTK